jgi:hypothetical protein
LRWRKPLDGVIATELPFEQSNGWIDNVVLVTMKTLVVTQARVAAAGGGRIDGRCHNPTLKSKRRFWVNGPFALRKEKGSANKKPAV